MNRQRAKPMPDIPYGPPAYMRGDTCRECWEPFGWVLLPFLDRWIHRRKWGHIPTPLHPRPTKIDLHARNVEGARRYREGHQ